VSAALAVLQGFTVSTLSLLLLFLGFSLLFTLLKLRKPGRRSFVFRGLGDSAGIAQTCLSSAAPHGTVDQLATPELLETRARKSA
jgi:hypothetical protein